MREKSELSRAEVARQRRAQRAAKELQQTGQRAVKPIIQRSAVRVVAPVKQTFVQTEKKRRFNVSLGLSDVHLRRPKLASRQSSQPDRRWRIASLVLAILSAVAIYFALVHPYFNIPSVTVLDNNRIPREEISDAAGVLGQSIFTVKPEEVEARLRMNYPELLIVDVEVYLPNHVFVTVQEREPLILWKQNEAYTWIDANGVAFRPRGVIEGLVSITGLANPQPGASNDPLVPPSFMQSDLADAIIQIAPSVPADTMLFYDGAYGLGWEDARGWKVYFGTGTRDMALKVRVYESLAQSLSERNLSPIFINVAYPEAPYYRMAAEIEFKTVTESNGQ